jgi:segregation and condensation protein A
MSLPVRLDVFEGPLDLLLFLIEKNKIDIYDIPIVTITEQYMAYIKNMQTEDMNVMSEFLVMAATLLDIKCRMLLPREVDEDGEEQDPREELVQKLLEYKMYKYMALELRDKQVDASKSWYKTPMLPKEVANYKAPINYEELIGDVNLAKLHDIFKAVIKRQEDKIDPIRSGFGKIEKDEINMEEKQLYIEDYIKSHKTFSFKNLLERQGSKMEVIVTFMAVLEMMKQGVIFIEQEETFSDIIITSALAA